MLKNRIDKEDLNDIAVGCTVLGSGGGGEVDQDLMLARYCLESYGDVGLIDIDSLDDNALVVPVGFMGAPSVCAEKLSNGSEFQVMFKYIERYFEKSIAAVVPAEIGGSNGLVPFIAASQASIDVIDGDTLGRAFPELHMSSSALFGINPSPAFMTDCLGNTVVLHVQNAKDVERFGRQVAQVMGSSCAVSTFIMTGKEAKTALIRSTVSQAREIGKQVRNKNLPKEAQFITQGVIIDVIQTIDGGFLTGKVVITVDGEDFIIEYQNEYLIARFGESIKAVTPDIIAIFEEQSLQPLSVEKLKYGLSVVVYSFPSPEIWKTEQGLKLVGPEAFGYKVGDVCNIL